MKKNLFLSGLLGAAILPASLFGWSWDAYYGHETEHVAVGCKWGQGKEELALTVLRELGNGSLFLGVDGRIMDDSAAVNRVAPRLDYNWNVSEKCYLNAGYQSLFYFRVPEGVKKHGNEIHSTFHWGDSVSAEGSVSYNFDEEDFGLSISLLQDYDLAAIGLNFLRVRSLFSAGYDHCARPGGVKHFFKDICPGNSCGFFYYGWGGDLILRMRSLPGSLSLGVRYAGNSASKENWNNADGHHRNLLWAAVGAAFQF
ncbi:MAG: hypothetical protein LBB14_03565 [Puniceicoccales bacterium]|nr:hypothetical protein [Puniceicoccales bacterium]